MFFFLKGLLVGLIYKGWKGRFLKKHGFYIERRHFSQTSKNIVSLLKKWVDRFWFKESISKIVRQLGVSRAHLAQDAAQAR